MSWHPGRLCYTGASPRMRSYNRLSRRPTGRSMPQASATFALIGYVRVTSGAHRVSDAEGPPYWWSTLRAPIMVKFTA